ncbi:subtilisin-like protease SBT3 [Cornus florida]|uniref:subtilisin-like protease SBT3 n=1 Tax=Cornus florida TaxID=4283 RepID=UPI002897EA4A|nr:subtilisin-like protease SBT3 [Cornus florida]
MECYLPFKLFSLFLLLSTALSASMMDDRGTYIIHMDKSAMPTPFSDHDNWYMSMISSLSSSDNGVFPIHLYTYNHVWDGFSAVLSRSQLEQLEKMPGHIATYPETFGKLHTTHSLEFLGLKKRAGLWSRANFGDDMIIGIIDTGIWPESKSFQDDGMPPVPERWHGACESGVEFNSSNCNRKLIGARSFSKGMKQLGLNISRTEDYDSPRDYFGHGTHTSSTAAGSPVQGANYFGYAKGTAMGVAPKARLAMYKVIFSNDDSHGVAATDTLAGMDQAIADGVDLMSLSLGFPETPFDENPIAMGAFAAMERGIFVSCSAGNSGPHGFTMLNGAPWITTVGAGTIDRDYAADVMLGDEVLTVRGKSVYPLDLLVSRDPIYFGQGNRSKELCEDYALDPKDVAGKFVFCDFINEDAGVNMLEIERSGAAGAIFSTAFQNFLRPRDFNLPYVAVTQKHGDLIKDYLIKTENATVSIKFQITVLGTKPAPMVQWFSSRGPDIRSPWILKPDILAPGVNILAAWAPNRGIAPIGDDYLLTDFTLLSGTSMASPHVVGVAALLKAVHKDWSPAAVRSAMMTTAYVIDNANGPIIDTTTKVAGTPLDFGAGHINPEKAMDPGLIYDIEVQDYINYLCGMNYTNKQIKVITRRSKFSCDQASRDLNYPSFIVLLNKTNTTSYTFNRVLTNVVDSPSVYRAVVKAPSGMKVVVQPPKVSFAKKYSKAEFKITVEVTIGDASTQSDSIINYGYLSWNDVKGTHMVRSPIVAAHAPYVRGT